MVASATRAAFSTSKSSFIKFLVQREYFRLPLNCYFRGIEWHEKLRECVNLDDVLKAHAQRGYGFETFSSST